MNDKAILESDDDEYPDWGEEESKLLQRLGFCGCGLPDESLKLIHSLLNHIEWRFERNFEGHMAGKEWDKYCNEEEESLQKVMDNHKEGLRYILFYLLDNKRITAHGGSVNGSWINDKEFKLKLDKYIDYLNRTDD